MSRSPSPAPGRSLDIELSGQEIITVDLDNLDADPDDLLDVLKESKSKVSVWLKLATEYWRRGSLDPAEKLAQGAIPFFKSNGSSASIPPIYALLANIQIARARNAPKLIIPEPRLDDMRKEKPKEEYYREAAKHVNSGETSINETGAQRTPLHFLTRGVLQLGTQAMDDALRTFDGVLSKQPTNVVANLGKARILYARRQYPQALRLFQTVLKHKPNCTPDPRIGIGLCLWAMDQKEKAKMAWERSLEVNPDSWPAQLLLGLDAINSSKDEKRPEVERRQEFLMGTRMVERAFKANQRNSAAANALCELLLRKGQHKNALKLAERTLQFADTLTILTEGHIRCGRVLHEQGAMSDAMRQYGQAAKGQPGNVLAAVGHAQTQLKLDEVSAAMHSLETLLQAPNTPPSIEATAMLASIRAVPRPGMSSAEIAQAKVNARELYDKVSKALHLPEATNVHVNGHTNTLTRSQRRIAEDVELHIEIAKLWFQDDADRAERGLQEALRLSERDGSGKSRPRLINNLGALHHIAGRYDSARPLYERSLMDATSSGSALDESASTSILYNLARLYEDQGDDAGAKAAYEKLLSRHPEYTDAKIRLAKMLASLNQSNDAHDLLKQALVSENLNLNLRAFYTHFLMQSNLPKPAKEFVFTTLKDVDRHDIYSLCAAGWIQYHQARESRDASPKGVEDRRSGFRRSAEFYEKALHLDPQCAFAAQGLAIATAEDAVGTLGGSLGPIAPDENAKRVKNARDALDVFAKVRESIDDGSVYANMGHCYYACDEYDRAIESYETASRKFYNHHNVPVLLCLCRSWYAKAIKDQSFKAMNSALRHAQSALHLHPQDKAILYNIAMIEQKAAEMLLPMKPAKRSLKEMQLAVQQAAHAQKLFQSLAADTSPAVPYSRELADQRRKYGESLLRRCDEQITLQKQHESESQAKMEEARRKRQEERDKLEAIERERLEVLRKEAEELAEKRKLAREQAYEWTKSSRLDVGDSDDEKEQRKARKAARPRPKPDLTGSGDEQEQKRKKRGKLRKNENVPEEDGALFSGEEDADGKPAAKKRTKKRVVRDDDEEEETSAPRKKQIKSKEFISDSDEEMS